jgi:hypothetical protein
VKPPGEAAANLSSKVRALEVGGKLNGLYDEIQLCLWVMLIVPGFVAEGGAVEFFAVVVPEGHEAVHIAYKGGVVLAFEEVDEFVDDDVFEAAYYFLDEAMPSTEQNNHPYLLHRTIRSLRDAYGHPFSPERLPLKRLLGGERKGASCSVYSVQAGANSCQPL